MKGSKFIGLTVLALTVTGAGAFGQVSVVGTWTGTVRRVKIDSGYAKQSIELHVTDQSGVLFRGFLITGDTNLLTGAIRGESNIFVNVEDFGFCDGGVVNTNVNPPQISSFVFRILGDTNSDLTTAVGKFLKSSSSP